MGGKCDGLEYDDFCHRKRHVCSGPMAPNHTLINDAKIRGRNNPKHRLYKDRYYFDKPINISWVCQKFHNEHGETRKFRDWFKTRQIWRYGRDRVAEYLERSPQRIKERI